MYEKKKNKRSFYENFEGSMRFYPPIISGDSTQSLSGARRKYGSKLNFYCSTKYYVCVCVIMPAEDNHASIVNKIIVL